MRTARREAPYYEKARLAWRFFFHLMIAASSAQRGGAVEPVEEVLPLPGLGAALRLSMKILFVTTIALFPLPPSSCSLGPLLFPISFSYYSSFCFVSAARRRDLRLDCARAAAGGG